MRRCKQCKASIPTFAKSVTNYEKRGCCSVECAITFGMAAVKRKEQLKQSEARKAMAAERRAYNAAKRARKPDLSNDFDHQVKLTQKDFNNMIRLLDEGKACISCDKMKCGYTWDAGHYHSVGSSFELRFDPRNCHLQGSGCNRTNHKANYKRRINTDVVNEGYQRGVVDRYGIDMLNMLDSYHPPKHYTCDDLKRMRKLFAAECKRLESGKSPSRDWRHKFPIFWIVDKAPALRPAPILKQ